jgi:alginate O-acetyltransferase complex protein AlgI
MLFNSLHFVVFFAGVFLLLSLVPGRFGKVLLVAASYYFYACSGLHYLPLLLGTTLIDYAVCRAMLTSQHAQRRKALLLLSLTGNLGILAVFKYGGFLWHTAADPFYSLAFSQPAPIFSIALPVGISFYTFQSMGHSIDVYRRRFVDRISFIDFALYVSFFPQLVAGPILRGADFFPQVWSRWRDRPVTSRAQRRDWWGAMDLVAVGLAKKILVADNLAPYVDGVFSAPAAHSWFEVTLATYAFAAQIYCDFSGYTDIARGVAKLLGIEIPLNFNYPYFASSLIEFWQRWHISLSAWLKDYLYISLGGNRHGVAKTYRNLMATMVLGGFWHGAAWNFIAWGAYHGALLVINHYWRRQQPKPKTGGPLATALQTLATFHLVVAGWFLFRIENLGDIFLVAGSASGMIKDPQALVQALVFFTAFAATHALRRYRPLRVVSATYPFAVQATVLAAFVLALLLLGAPTANFIYFQF